MTLIGCRCRGGNVYSRAILITQTLSGKQFPPKKTAKDVAVGIWLMLRKSEYLLASLATFSTYTDGCPRKDNAKEIKVVIAWGFHLFPFRTEKLNLTAPMVLRKWESRSPPPIQESLDSVMSRGFLFLYVVWVIGIMYFSLPTSR